MFLRAIDPLPARLRLAAAVEGRSASSRSSSAWRCWSARFQAAATRCGRSPACSAAQPAHARDALAAGRLAAELDEKLKAPGKPAMLDFYADWCVSCKEMERFTFSDPKVRAQLDGMLLLQADVTANNEADSALLKRFSLFGPPGIMFFDPQGREIEGLRVIGYQNPERFLKTLSLATAP